MVVWKRSYSVWIGVGACVICIYVYIVLCITKSPCISLNCVRIPMYWCIYIGAANECEEETRASQRSLELGTIKVCVCVPDRQPSKKVRQKEIELKSKMLYRDRVIQFEWQKSSMAVSLNEPPLKCWKLKHCKSNRKKIMQPLCFFTTF